MDKLRLLSCAQGDLVDAYEAKCGGEKWDIASLLEAGFVGECQCETTCESGEPLAHTPLLWRMGPGNARLCGSAEQGSVDADN